MSKARDFKLFLQDILDSIEKIERGTKRLTRKGFIDDDFTNAAIV